MSEESVKSGFTPENILYTPDNIVNFISMIGARWKPEKILDPACGIGSFFPEIASLMEGNPQCTGVDIGAEIIKNADDKLINTDIDYNLINNDFFVIKDDIKDKFDLILSQPSFVQLQVSEDAAGLNMLDLEFRLMVESLSLLEDRGHLIMILPEQKSFFFSNYYRPVRDYLVNKYSVEAIISLPTQTLYPYSSIKTCILILKNSPQRDNVFFAQYNKNFAKDIIENFFGSKSNDNLSQGFWVDKQSLKKEGSIWTFDYFRTLKDLEQKQALSKYPLKTLLDIGDIVDNLSDSDDLILIPKEPHIDVILKSRMEDPHETEKYYSFKINNEYVSTQYLIMYLNSEMMKNERNLLSTGTTIKSLDIQSLKSIYIELPDLKLQNKIVHTGQTADEIHQLLETAYQHFQMKIFNYQELQEVLDRFDLGDNVYYNKMIWPFATSYSTIKENPSSNTIVNNYFKFFEMITAFNAIVLLSALPNEIYKENKDYIWPKINKNNRSYKIGFGTWFGVYSRLSRVYNKLDNNIYDMLPFGRSFYNKITSKKIFPTLNAVIQKRNEWSHGGVLPEVCADKIVTDLNKYLDDIFDVLRAFNSLKLIYTLEMEKNRGMYTIKSKKLKGNSNPSYYEFHSETDMDTKELYFYDPVTDDRLRLLPELIRLIDCPGCGRLSLYFYNSQTTNGLKYISYQDEPHDQIKKFEDSMMSIDDLIDYKKY